MDCQGGRGTRSAVPRLSLGALLLALALPATAGASVSVGDVQVTEANSSVNATFTITRQAALLAPPISVAFTTGDGSAVAPADYSATSGTRSFGPGGLGGTQVQNVTVVVRGDALREFTESFRLVVTGAEVVDGEGTATIADDDPRPAVSVETPAATKESAAQVSFSVRLSAPSGLPVTVAYATSDAAAKAGADYLARSGVATIPAGRTASTIDVALRNDKQVEQSEAFELRLSGPAQATLGNAFARATILDDDGAAAIGLGGTLAGGSRLGLSRLRLRHDKVASFKVACPAPAGRCQGRVSLFTRPNATSKLKALREERRLGRRSFSVAGGHSRTIRMTLRRTDRSLLRRAGRLRVRAFATAQDTSGRAGTGTLLGTLRRR